MKKEYFKKFMKTGKISDYLKYSEEVKKEKSIEKNRGDNSKKHWL